MKHFLCLASLAVLSGCVSVPISPSISGRVVDANEQPVKAEVRLQHVQLSEKVSVTTTDERGEFSIKALRIWTAVPFSAIRMESKVTVNADGFLPFEVSTEDIANDQLLIKLESE